MKHEPKGQTAKPTNRQGDVPTRVGRRLFPRRAAGAGAAVLLAIAPLYGEVAAAGRNSADELRRFIDEQVGGLDVLKVPARDEDLPQPLLEDGSIDPNFAITPERVFLGKQLFFDPVRTANIQPEFGGILSTAQTGSCGSCHIGLASGKSGELFNFNVGGEGRGFTDAEGNFTLRRRAIAGLIDKAPTLTEVFKSDEPDAPIVISGMFDAIDSVPRLTPNMVGFAFNNRLLLGGLAGNPGPDNPNEVTAQDNLTELTIQVHRMFEAQAPFLQQIPVYVKLFQDAFPVEAAEAELAGNLDPLINDDTVSRAMAAFLRTSVTRNTPWDKFLAGDNRALTAAQRRGARLFFTPAEGGTGGAGCLACHSGSQLNKQLGDEEGSLVEENFVNLGLGDHPLQALNAEVFDDPNFRDRGRMNDTDDPANEFQIRTVTLRQLKTAGQFMHSGQFDDLRDVVEYFNAGVPADEEAAASPTFDSRFSNPRGPDFPAGLGLSRRQVDDLTDFIDNALFDPAFAKFDPTSTTNTFELNERDLTYSLVRPDLAALGAVDGFVASGLNISSNDALSRRDAGLEFLDVTAKLDVEVIRSDNRRRRGVRLQRDVVKITNNSSSVVDTHLLVIPRGLPRRTRLVNPSRETTAAGERFVRVFLDDDGGVLKPGESVVQTLFFKRRSNRRFGRGYYAAAPVKYELLLLSGQGTP